MTIQSNHYYSLVITKCANFVPLWSCQGPVILFLLEAVPMHGEAGMMGAAGKSADAKIAYFMP
jgi:hypothetical protein